MIDKRILVLAAGLGLIGAVQTFLPVSSLSASTPVRPTIGAATEINEHQVREWINAKAQEEASTESFTFQQVNLDEDEDLEIIAKHNGAVHIGSFYVLDRQPDGRYSLIAEKSWNVPRFQLERWDVTRYEDDSEWNTRPAKELGIVAGKRLFETVNHTGGTGLDTYEAHLWYLENGQLVDAWNGTLQETSQVPGGQLFQTAGSYQLALADSEHPVLYTWKLTQELDPESGVPLSDQLETTAEVLYFEQGMFQKRSAPTK
ncbi:MULTISPECIES: hypothetical protein [Brevibacillus]|uniref:Uncharacterized protein n=1 Tax=Brevibacillus invocatus TaxID=173959 RepID=A0A3M8C5Z8_9BACL|nr:MULTISPECIES: hypothetical protein [Brevibacillus]MDH4616299.1 hypothetical protein [Brevibacillus sp. AY1]RNB71126.1 hypothetical protein EDM52_15700 [Brevibacillus invocatus]